MTRVVKLGIKRPVTRPLLPDPEPRPVKYTFISVDDHLMEPPHTFEGRLPSRLQDRAPRVIETEEGHEIWQFEDTPYFQVVHVRGRAPARRPPLEPGARYFGAAAGTSRRPVHDIGGIYASGTFRPVSRLGATLFSRRRTRIGSRLRRA